MKINLAVYTAIQGYDWQPGTAYSTSDLVRFKRGIGRLPDPLMEELPFGGVFNDGDTVVFYRYHMAIKSDAKGRDSLYLVLGTLPKSEAGKVDFKYLFALSELAKPMKPAPVQATYVGSFATGTPPDFSASIHRCLTGCEALSEIGVWFSRLPDGTLSMRITGAYANPVINIQYEKPRSETPTPSPSVPAGIPTSQWMTNRPVENRFPQMVPQMPPVPSKPPLQNYLLPVALAFLIGGIAGWYAKGAKDWIADTMKTIQDMKPAAPTDVGIQPLPPPFQPPPTPSSQEQRMKPGIAETNGMANAEAPQDGSSVRTRQEPTVDMPNSVKKGEEIPGETVDEAKDSENEENSNRRR